MTEVAEAHLLMKDVAKNIDQVKKNLEQQSRVKELSGILDGWLGPGMRMIYKRLVRGAICTIKCRSRGNGNQSNIGKGFVSRFDKMTVFKPSCMAFDGERISK